MKKLMIVLAAVALAGITQAATMTWSVSNMQAMGIENGNYIALFDGTTTFDYAKAKDGTLAAWYTGTATETGTAGMVKAGGSGLNNPSGDAFAPGDTISMYMVVFNSDSIASATQYLVSDVATGSVKANGANFTVSFGSLAATTTSNKFLGATWQSVPEPTSGLLMLVGLGALALRRRRA